MWVNEIFWKKTALRPCFCQFINGDVKGGVGAGVKTVGQAQIEGEQEGDALCNQGSIKLLSIQLMMGLDQCPVEDKRSAYLIADRCVCVCMCVFLCVSGVCVWHDTISNHRRLSLNQFETS